MGKEYNYSVAIEPYEPAEDETISDLGPLEREIWKLDGKLHNHRGPAVIIRQIETGRVVQEEFFERGRRHREIGPAFIVRNDFDEERQWYLEDQLHRKGGPAIEVECLFNQIRTQEVWIEEGKIHRKCAPARICRDDATGDEISIEYFEDGQLHRIDGGPALIEADPNMAGAIVRYEWYRDGALFREGGQPTKVYFDYALKRFQTEDLNPTPD